MKDFLTAGELARRLGVATVTARRWYKLGLFPHAAQVARTGKGGIWLVPESDLAGFERPKVGRPSKPRRTRRRGAGPKDPFAGLEPCPWEPAKKVVPRPKR